MPITCLWDCLGSDIEILMAIAELAIAAPCFAHNQQIHASSGRLYPAIKLNEWEQSTLNLASVELAGDVVTEADLQVPRDLRSGFSGLQVGAMVVGTILLVVILCWWVVTRYIIPTELKQVELTRQEQIELDRKLGYLGIERQPVDGRANDNRALPEPYTEEGAPREIELSERELNSLFARDPELGSRIAIDLAPDLVSLNALVPVPEDFPIMPGKMVRVRAGAEFSFDGSRPVLILKGVSIMGVPLPNAWLGNLKNIDLIADSGNEAGFWRAFADGVEYVQVEDGRLRVTLRE
jgi:hypothetical protein